MCRLILLIVIAVFVSRMDFCYGNQKEKPLKKNNHIMPKGYFVQETEDKDWSCTISGDVVSMCGIYVIVYDVNKKIIYQGKVPHGKYSIEKPYVIKIKKDGAVGDYKIKILAAQPDFMAFNLPMTELKEVYEIQSTTIGHDKDRYLMFQVPPGQKELTVSAYKGHLQVTEEATGKVVADTSKGEYGGEERKSKHRYCNYISFNPFPETTYRLEPKSFYFRFGGATIYTMFKPDGWFLPNPKLSEIKWWRLKLL